MKTGQFITKKDARGITLIALIITIIVMLILAGVTINLTLGDNGIFTTAVSAKKAQIKAEMREKLSLSLLELQANKKGEATLDDVTQEWADNKLGEYNPVLSEDASIAGKKITMTKDSVIGKYIIDEKLNITETEDITGPQLTYEVKSRDGENLSVVVTVTDSENGLDTIEYNDGHIEVASGAKSISRDCTIQLGVEYTVKIKSKSGVEKTETILINDYYYTITKNLDANINIDNEAVKAAYNRPYEATLTTLDEYVLDTLTVTMGGEVVSVDKTTGKITIEQVTGDIEITATAKKLAIEISEVYVNTTQNATSSANANSVDKSVYKLYVTFTATLGGEACTIEPALSEAITKNGTYTYTITGTYGGKTISTTKEVVVNQYKSAAGLVKYDAGEWTATEIQALQNSKLYDINISKTTSNVFKLLDENGYNFTFGGFTYKGNETYSNEINSGTVITSRNQSVAPEDGWGVPYYEGWQIMSSETKEDENGNTIKNADGTDRVYVTKIMHAGSPENFAYYHTVSYDTYRAEYLLSSGKRQTNMSTLSDGTTINVRNWDMYKDVNQLDLIKEVNVMTRSEADKMTAEQLATGSGYWLAYGYSSDFWSIEQDGTDGPRGHHCFGVRPVVTMVDGVYIASGTGTEADPYVLAKE